MLEDMVHVLTMGRPGSRAFIRPAGTENCVRIYVEAKTEADVNIIMTELMDEVTQRYESWGQDKEGKCAVMPKQACNIF